jgi:transposase
LVLDSNPEEIIAQYKGLWQVEQTFRISKHNLEIRPVYHWNTDRIKAHFAICFLALSLIRYTEVLLKNKDEYIPIEQLHQLLDMVKIVNITSKGENYQIRTDMPQSLVMIYRALGVSRSKIFVHLS